MENEVNNVVDTNANYELIRDAAVKGAVAAIAGVVVTRLADVLIDKTVEVVRSRREAKKLQTNDQ